MRKLAEQWRQGIWIVVGPHVKNPRRCSNQGADRTRWYIEVEKNDHHRTSFKIKSCLESRCGLDGQWQGLPPEWQRLLRKGEEPGFMPFLDDKMFQVTHDHTCWCSINERAAGQPRLHITGCPRYPPQSTTVSPSRLSLDVTLPTLGTTGEDWDRSDVIFAIPESSGSRSSYEENPSSALGHGTADTGARKDDLYQDLLSEADLMILFSAEVSIEQQFCLDLTERSHVC